MTSRTGFIGLGAMGEPMAGHLATANLLHMVWNRTTSKAQQFSQQHNVQTTDDLEALANQCNLILICVSADQDVTTIIDSLMPALTPGTIIIDHSTIAPDTTQNLAKRLLNQQVELLDGPVSGGVEGAKNGKLSVMIGGSKEALQQAQPVLDCYAARVSHMGNVGNGQATKAVNQVLVAGIAEAVCEGLALAERLELPTDELLQVLQNGAAGSWFLDKRGATMLADDCDVGFKLELLIKDLRICEQLAQHKQVRLDGVTRALADYLKCLDSGDGAQDISALIRLKRKQLDSD